MRVEPTEAPRDNTPYLPPKSKNAKALRLENEASDRMWELLLREKALDDLRAEEHEALFEQSRKADEEYHEISEGLLNLTFEDSKLTMAHGARIEKRSVWLDHTGPAVTKNHHKQG